jgi:hypothetical protein
MLITAHSRALSLSKLVFASNSTATRGAANNSLTFRIKSRINRIWM